MFFGFLNDGVNTMFVHPGGIKNIESERVIVGRAQSDLHRVRRIDETFLDRVPEYEQGLAWIGAKPSRAADREIQGYRAEAERLLRLAEQP